jgi:hypothetical protein
MSGWGLRRRSLVRPSSEGAEPFYGEIGEAADFLRHLPTRRKNDIDRRFFY